LFRRTSIPLLSNRLPPPTLPRPNDPEKLEQKLVDRLQGGQADQSTHWSDPKCQGLLGRVFVPGLNKVCDGQAKVEEIEALQGNEEEVFALQEQLEHSQHSLADCQQMLEELQEFSEAQSSQLAALQARLQVCFFSEFSRTLCPPHPPTLSPTHTHSHNWVARRCCRSSLNGSPAS